MKKVRQREIKFRAWFEGVNLMGNVITMKGSNRNGYVGNIWDEVTAECYENGRQQFYSSYNFTLMQWAGITDKNGRDIFEDDIVHCSIEGDNVGNVDTIEFKNGSFWLRYRDRSLSSWTEFGNELEVIGNIWKHPNLLSQGEIKTELI